MKLLIALLFCAMTLGCGYGSSYNNGGGGNSVPTVTQLMPNTATAGGAAFTLTITGTHFTTGSLVYWGTTPLTGNSVYGSATQMTANIGAPMIANTGTINVYVHSAGGNSNTMMFTIQ
jgi:hypothetical protein